MFFVPKDARSEMSYKKEDFLRLASGTVLAIGMGYGVWKMFSKGSSVSLPTHPSSLFVFVGPTNAVLARRSRHQRLVHLQIKKTKSRVCAYLTDVEGNFNYFER